jgi:coenzyme F420-reducing hydrogenase alpha subunit
MSTTQDKFNLKQDVSLVAQKLIQGYKYLLGSIGQYDPKEVSLEQLEQYASKNIPYVGQLVEDIKEIVEEIKSLDIAQPGSFYMKEEAGRIYDTLVKVDKLVSGSKDKKYFREHNWKDGLDNLYNALETWRKETKPYIDRAKENFGAEMKNLERLAYEGKLTGTKASQRKGKPEKKLEAEEEAVTTPAEKTFAMIVILAFGFTMLSGLNNLSRAAAGSGLQSLDTGFYLLPGGPFITSLQMVLFMLSSVVVIVYLFGKSFGEW